MFYEQKHSTTNDHFYLSQTASTNFNFPLHFHGSYEFIYVEEGVLKVEISGVTFNVQSGEGALIIPNQPHAYSTPEHSRAWLVIFSQDHIPELKKITSANGSFHPIINAPCPDFHNYFLKIQHNPLRVRSLLYELAAAYCEGESAPQLDSEDSATVCKMVEYIDAHYTEPMSLFDLSQALGYSYRYMSGVVNKFFKLSLPQIVNRYRVSYACKMLSETETDITEIALLCGFGSMRSFNRNFKDVTGVSPREYRTSNK